MSTTRVIAIFDRFALSFMNTLVLVGLPMVAISLITQSIR